MNTIPDIKTIIPLTCPDCKHEIVVSLRLPTPAAPEYLEASNPTLIQASKEELMTYIDTLEMPKEEKKELYNWIYNEDTILMPLDIVEIKNKLDEQYATLKKGKAQ